MAWLASRHREAPAAIVCADYVAVAQRITASQTVPTYVSLTCYDVFAMSKADQAEECACNHLMELGMVIVERNWRCRAGELDIIARDGPVLVFVEVRSKSGSTHGSPEESLTLPKLRRLWRAAHQYLETQDPPFFVRFDVVAVGPEGIRHIPDAFGEQDVRQVH